MKRVFRFLSVCGLFLAAAYLSRAEESSKEKPESAASGPSLRKPGFVFMELATTRPEAYLAYFESVAGFKAVRQELGYIQARSEHAELTFLDPTKIWAKGHPFSGKLNGTGQGLGIEIGIVVADLDKAYAAASALKDKGWPISTGIVLRPWGVRDFRVLAPEGYYFRFTEGR